MKTFRESPFKLEEFRILVENGEYQCAYNPTVSGRNPHYNPSDSNQTCSNTATHIETVTRRFAFFTSVIDVPLCDDHTGWFF